MSDEFGLEVDDELKETEKMLADLDSIFAEDGVIKKFKGDYVPRESQIEASKLVLSAVREKSHIIMEGPCGFGKTFAYLTPVFLQIAQNPKLTRVIVVTDGISLQEQLYYKDLPFIKKLFQEMYSQDIQFAMLKGKGNFICENKVTDLLMTKNMQGAYTPKILRMYSQKKIPGGDISHLDFVPDYQSLSEVSCTSEGECAGSSCGFYEQCHYQIARQKASSANIVVTNYHMLFSDLRTEGKILGAYNVLVFDEAHEIANIYRDFLEKKASVNSIQGIKKKFAEIGNMDDKVKDYYIGDFSFDYFLRSAESYFERVKKSLFIRPKEEIKILDETIPLCLYPDYEKDFVNELGKAQRMAGNILEYAQEKTEDMINFYGSVYDIPVQEREQYNHYVSIFNKTLTMSERISEITALITEYKKMVEGPENVLWVENKEDKVTIQMKPVSVANALYGNFFARRDLCCIVTSATLSVNGNFEYIKNQLGLNLLKEDKKLIEYIGSSPFDLERQELWYLPEKVVDGDNRNSRAFQELLPKQITEIIEVVQGGALCLFTSYSNLNLAYEAVVKALPKVKIMKQGDLPRTKLIEEFKEDRDSVLFATRSFFTGVDIPGDSLRCVMLDKFPFPSPGDPVMMKIQKIYGDQTFIKHYVPEMVITLKQAVGRGVRTVTDKCVIVILDGRMASAGYKGAIFNSFPYQKTGTRSIDQVKNFLER